MNTITLGQLLQVHVLVASATGGSMGLRDLGRLEAAIATQTQTVFGEELYPSIFDKAAAMVRTIIADHPFIDGNKRTGMLTGLVLLEINSQQFIAKPSEVEDFAVSIAIDKLDIPAIASWLREHTETTP